MRQLATLAAVFTLLGMGTASADMIAGTFCVGDGSRVLVWQSAAPSGLVTQNGRCGAESLGCGTNQVANFQTLLDKKNCESVNTEGGVAFVCTEKSNKITKHIEDLCKQVITGETQN